MSLAISLAWRLSRANTLRPLNVATAIGSSLKARARPIKRSYAGAETLLQSEVKIRFDIAKLSVGARLIDLSDGALAPSVSVIRGQAKTITQRDIHADVPYIGEAAVADG